MDTSSHDPTIQNSTLLRFAKAALAEDRDPQDLPWEDIDLTDPEQRRFGDYELLELLGRGGMGVVYRARQAGLDREVAIKFIASNIADQPEVIGRFMAEAQAAAKLHHPNIVPVFEVGSVDCLYYFTMPLLRGKTLADLGRLPVDDAVAMMRKLCSAVSYAHSLGLLHLDLKPANVMIDEHGRPMIGDFGLARQMDEDRGVTAQEVSGTPAFMAPEQVQINQYRLTEATDLYALGAILYQVLSGQSPHGRGSAETLMKNAVAGRIAALRDVDPSIPRDIAAICAHCLELHAEDRYPSVADLGHDLDRFIDGVPVSVRVPSLAERARRTVMRNPLLSATVAVALAALILGFIGTTWQWREAERARHEAEQNFQSALNAANTLVREVTETIRPLIGSKADTVRKILESTQGILDELGDRQDVAIARALMLGELSRTYGDLGDIEAAALLADRAVEHGETALTTQPAQPDAMLALAKALLARALLPRPNSPDDLADLRRALELTERLPATTDPVERVLLVSTILDGIAGHIIRPSEFPKAVDHLERSGAMVRSALQQHPGDERLLSRLSYHYKQFGHHYVAVEVLDYATAIEKYKESLLIRQQLAENDTSDARHRYELARLHFVIGLLTDDPEEKISRYLQSIEIHDHLAGTDPTNKNWLFQLAHVKGSLARQYRQLGRLEDAFETYQEVLPTLDSLLQHDPANERWLDRKASVFQELGLLEQQRSNYRKAAGYRAAEVEIRRGLDNRWALGVALRGEANVLNWSMRADDALKKVEEAIAILSVVDEDSPESPGLWHADLGSALYTAAAIALGLGQFENAVAYQERAIEQWRFLSANHPEIDGKYGDWNTYLALDLKYLGLIQFMAGRFEAAIEAAKAALQILPELEGARGLMGQALVGLDQPVRALEIIREERCDPCRLLAEARAYEALGDVDAAQAAIQELVANHAQEWVPYDIACLFALTGNLDEAFSWLRKARPQDLYVVNIDRRLAPLRSDSRWPEFLESLQR